jgi:hypothetical protein
MARNKGKKLGGVPSIQAMRTARDDLRRAAHINRNKSGVCSSQMSGGWGFAACDTELGADYALMRTALANFDGGREIETQRGPPVDTDLLRAVIDVLDKAQKRITNGKGAVAGETHNAAGEVTAFGVLFEARNALWGEGEAFGRMVDDPDDDGGALLGALYRLRDLARRLGLSTTS